MEGRHTLPHCKLGGCKRIEPFVFIQQSPRRRVPPPAVAHRLPVLLQPPALVRHKVRREAAGTAEQGPNKGPFGTGEGGELAETARAQHPHKLIGAEPAGIHLQEGTGLG
jgi:hypothetical protein